MLTLKQVNSKIAELGFKAELVKGEGYFYFIGDDVDLCYSTSVGVYRLNHLSMEDWLSEIKGLVEEHVDRKRFKSSFQTRLAYRPR